MWAVANVVTGSRRAEMMRWLAGSGAGPAGDVNLRFSSRRRVGSGEEDEFLSAVIASALRI